MGWHGIEGFNADCALFVAQNREQAGKVLRYVALEALKGVVEMTPVDRGQLRQSWFVTFDAPVDEALPERGGGAITPASQTISAGAARIALAKVGDVVFIGNAMPYAEVVEFGGFVPRNPPEDPKSLQRRAASRSKPRRAQARLMTSGGHEGGTFVAGGYSKQAPAGMVGVTFERLRELVGAPR